MENVIILSQFARIIGRKSFFFAFNNRVNIYFFTNLLHFVFVGFRYNKSHKYTILFANRWNWFANKWLLLWFFWYFSFHFIYFVVVFNYNVKCNFYAKMNIVKIKIIYTICLLYVQKNIAICCYDNCCCGGGCSVYFCLCFYFNFCFICFFLSTLELLYINSVWMCQCIWIARKWESILFHRRLLLLHYFITISIL